MLNKLLLNFILKKKQTLFNDKFLNINGVSIFLLKKFGR